MNNPNVTIKLNETLLEEFVRHYKDYQIDNSGEYIVFFAKKEGTTITVYESKRGFTAFFVGPKSLDEAKNWDETASLNILKIKQKSEWLCTDDQIGSDEVGVGDFFLPMIVVGAYIKKEDIEYLKDCGINDSKKIKDEDILEIVPKIINRVNISKLTLTNEKYNQMVVSKENINTLKAKMHNQVLKNLAKTFETKNIFIDQFVKEETYYKYLVNDTPLTGITFKTKGESYYPSIAVASMVARYCFLKEKEKLERKYGLVIPFGAGKKVNEFAVNFINKFGLEEFEKNVKKNFANYDEVINKL